MIPQKVFSPIFILLATLCLLFSCTTDVKNNPKYTVALNKAETFYAKQEYDSAFYYYNKIKSLCTEGNDTKNIIYPMLRMGEIEGIKGDLQNSEKTFTEVLPFLKDNPREDFLVSANNNLGLLYLEQHNYREAFRYFNKMLAISTDTLSKCNLKNNLAYIYIKQQKYSNAIAILNPLQNNDTLRNHPVDLARVLDNLGIAYLENSDFIRSKKYLDQAKQLREAAQDSADLTSSFYHLAKYYQNSNQSLALQNATTALQTATKVKNANDQLEVLSFLIENETDKESKKYAMHYLKLNDSVKTAQQQAKNQFAKIKYDSQQALNEAKKQKTIKEYFILGLVALLLISLYGYYTIKKRNQKKLREVTYSTETRIAKKLHDELANDVHNTMTFADTQNLEKQENKEQLLQNLETIYKRTRNLSAENSAIETGTKYLENLKTVLKMYDTETRNIIMHFQNFVPDKLNSEIKITLFRILQELMVNMHKHSQASVVVLKIENTKKQLLVSYTDNGVGTEIENFKKNGLQNAENRIFSLNGTITFETNSNKGFKSNIKIPL